MAIIPQAIFAIVFIFVFGVMCFYTGELTLKLVTLGRHKLQLNPFHSGVSNVNRGTSIAIGGLLWLGFSLVLGFPISWTEFWGWNDLCGTEIV